VENAIFAKRGLCATYNEATPNQSFGTCQQEARNGIGEQSCRAAL
jgi:hypothetical protein